MEHFDDVLVLHQIEQGGQVDFRRQRVDAGGFVHGRDLDQAQLRPIGFFADEFRVNGDERVFRQPRAKPVEFFGCLDECAHIFPPDVNV